MTDDKPLLSRIDELVAEEHELRTKHAAGQINETDGARSARSSKVELDQCWDLLRSAAPSASSARTPTAPRPAQPTPSRAT